MLSKTLLRLLAVACVCTPCFARAQLANPFDADAIATSAGQILYGNRCSECHGADAKGLIGPDLTLLWVSGASDERIFATLRAGVPNTVMPPSSAPDDDHWAIIAYLKSISTVPAFASERGNAARGHELFSTHCAACHRAQGAGGSLGPDLSRIALVRERGALISAIRDPDALVAAGFKTVTLVTREGARIEGLKKSEDAFSIQILDSQEQLRGYLKTSLVQVERERRSLMPAFGPDRLTDDALDDLLAFLATLRGQNP
jgi:putative heme-binding domain-containing protein